jgi:hypothetical protein
MVRVEDEVYNTAVFQDATKTFESVAGFKIYGNEGMVGDEFTRDIFLFEAAKNGKTPLNHSNESAQSNNFAGRF